MPNKEVNAGRDNIHQIAIALELDTETTLTRMKLRRLSDRMKQTAGDLIQVVNQVARPKAIYRVSCSTWVDSQTVDISGVKFTSRVLSQNLRKLETVFPYIVTCGRELDGIKAPAGETMTAFILDSIKTMALISAVQYLAAYLDDKYSLKKTAHMNPGELEDWPISQQQQLFSLFGNTEQTIGVRLMESNFMQPIKSRSGVYFSNDTGFISCRLCTQENCPGRKAPYNPELITQYQ